MIVAQVSVFVSSRPLHWFDRHLRSLHFYTSAFISDPDIALRALVLPLARFHSGNGKRTRNISSSWPDSCGYISNCKLRTVDILFCRSICQAILFLVFGRFDLYVNALGFVALGMESTLPIPQLIRYFFP